MENVKLNQLQKIILDEALLRQRNKSKRRFSRRHKTHFNDPKLQKAFYKLTVDFSDNLYEIPFKCYFSFYLYLILKSKVKYIDWIDDMPCYFKIAISQDLNVMQISREFGICRNTIRKAFKELVKYRLIEESPEIAPYHKSTKSIIVYNDYYIHSFFEEYGHVVYNTEIPFNFYNK